MATLTLSKQAINQAILAFEVGYDKLSEFSYYNKKLTKPTVPAWQTTDSGVTIGIGFDCGYNTPTEIKNSWSSILPEHQVNSLVKCSGKKRKEAFDLLATVNDIVVPIEDALRVFYNTTIYKFGKEALKVYPNLPNIHPVEQSVIVGLVFNRGNDIDATKDRRKEMRQLVAAIKNDNDAETAQIIRNMKRLWADVKGLRIRRDVEADLIAQADTQLPDNDILKLIIN